MHVARYWRTKKLRYRLFTIPEQIENGRAGTAVKAKNNPSRDHLPEAKRVKALS